MSVREFYADEWQSQAVGLAMGLKGRSDKLTNLGQGLQDLVDSRQIYGQGADSMKAYISEVHVSLIQSLLMAVQTFQTATGVYYNGYQRIDSSGDFKLIKEDLEGHVRQLNRGMTKMSTFQSRIQGITRSVDDIIYLGGAGSRGLNYVKLDFEEMLRIVTTQLREWEGYEQGNEGFNKVETLLGELKNMLGHIGQLTVGSGREYQAGSFNQSLQVLRGLVTDVDRYNQTNAKVAATAWQDMVDDYVKDVKRIQEAAEKKAKLKNYSLLALLSEGVGVWYSKNVAKPAIASGNSWKAFGAGVLGGAGDMVKGVLTFDFPDTVKGLYSLAFDKTTRKQFGKGMSHWWDQVSHGNAYVLGEATFNLASLVIGTGEVQGAVKVARASQATSLLSKTGTFAKALGLSGAKNVTNLATMPGRVGHSLYDLLKNPSVALSSFSAGSRTLLNRIKGGDALPKKTGGVSSLDTQLGSLKNNIKINKYESAESVNNWWKVEKGYDNPPYTSRTVVQDIEVLSDEKFVRVYDGDVSGLKGGWLMKGEDIKVLTPKQIQEKFALPAEPIYIGEVTIPKGSNLRVGEVAENFGYKGGGIQFDLKGQYIGEYKEIGEIIDWGK